MFTGVDISAWAHDDHDHPQVDFQLLRESGARFVIVKATHGILYTNPWLAADVEHAHKAGLLVGVLHYALPGEAVRDDPEGDGKAQALYVLGATAELPLTLGIACEVVESGRLMDHQVGMWYQAFAGTIEETGQTSPLLVDRPTLARLIGAPWGNRLWLATDGAGVDAVPEDVRPWMVQTHSGPAAGFAGEVEHDVLLAPRSVNPVITSPKKPARKAGETAPEETD